MSTPPPLLLLATENPAKGRARIELVAPGVVAATTAGDGPSKNPKRSPNEDSLAVVHLGGGAWAVIVADSHYGAAAGEIVARGFVELVARLDPGALDERALGELLLDLDDRVRAGKPRGDPSETAGLAAVVRRGELVFASVADCRVFRARPRGAIELLSGDGRLFLGNAKPLRARPGGVEPLELGRAALVQGDVVLLASDGIDEEVSGLATARVGEVVGAAGALEERVARLLALGGLAANGGGRDNLSVVALEQG